jgi:hypothetical protein
MPEEDKKGNRSIEELGHFSCRECEKWWSIGDAPESKRDWFCPWCGEENTYDA